MKKLLSVIVLTASIFSCADKEPPTPAYDISVSQNSVSFEQNSTSAKSVAVTTDDPKWKVSFANSADQSWLEAGANSYSKTVAIKPKSANTEVSSRSAVINVSTESGSKSLEITVTQLGYGAEILLDLTKIDAQKEGIAEQKIEVTTNIEYEIILPSWVTVVTKTKAMEKFTHYFKIAPNAASAVRSGDIVVRGKGQYANIEKKISIIQEGTGGNIIVPTDKKFTPVGGRALNNEFQPGGEIRLAFDGDMGTIYHSRWAGTVFPVQLEFDMPATCDKIDYIVYNTRQPGGNGNFGNVELWANTTTNATFTKLGDWNFGQAAGAFPMFIKDGITSPKSFRFVVKDGAGNFASCSEMEFYQYGKEDPDQKAAIEKVFVNAACMELKNGVTEADIAELPKQLQVVASKLRAGTYPREFRCESYKAYSNPGEWGQKNVSRPYSNLDNPTGIEVKANEKFYVYVGTMGGNNVSLLNVDNKLVSGQTFMLREGMNEFTPTNNGQLYIQYYVADPSTAKSIDIHFPEVAGGYVCGYFNLEKHKSAQELDRIMKLTTTAIGGGTFTIQGKYVQWNFLKSSLNHSPSDLIDALNIWDEMVLGHWELMGIGESSGQFPGKRNNRQLACSTVDGYYMYATDYFVHFAANTISQRTSKASMFGTRDLMWGPGHEFGHQSDKALTWHGYSEASNNLFSNLTTWQYAQKYNSGSKTRGPGMQMLNKYSYEKGLNFMDFAFWENKGTDYDSDGLFLECRQYWQLYVYYHILGKEKTFYPKFFKLLRDNYSPLLMPQERSMQFYKLACDATGTDLTEFFEAWGWFNLIDKEIDQYGKVRHLLTQAMVDAAKSYVALKGYPKALPLQYIEDRETMDREDSGWASSLGQVGVWTTFRDNLKVSSNISYTLNGEAVSILNGGNAVGFEVRAGSPTAKVLAFSVRFGFTTNKLSGANKLYAVQADGTRIEIPRK